MCHVLASPALISLVLDIFCGVARGSGACLFWGLVVGLVACNLGSMFMCLTCLPLQTVIPYMGSLTRLTLRYPFLDCMEPALGTMSSSG